MNLSKRTTVDFKMNMNAKEFNEKATQENKRFQLEAFSFTHDFGLNIHIDDYDDLKEITEDTEYEFWALYDEWSKVEISVDSHSELKLILDALIDLDLHQVDLIERYAALVNYGATTWEDVASFYEDNYVTEFENKESFGRYLIEELNCLDVPSEILYYFNFEAYARDALIDGYFVCEGHVYRN